MHKAGAHTKGILAYLRERSGKLVALRDVHSMIQSFKREQRAGLTDAERALAILDEFCAESTGNVAEIMVDAESKVARVITFQSARMKRLFRAFPEVVLVDATHDTNANRYKLFSFAVHDVFGKSEEKPNLRLAVKCFQKHNPAWTKIRVLVTDKAMHEKAVLLEGFPEDRQLLCQWHVITWLKKQSTPTYSVALRWMQEFYDALQGGDVPKFVMEVSPRIGLEGLPQVSSEESTVLTQISLASPASQTPSAAAVEGDTDDLEEKSAVPVQDESAADHDVQDEDARESGTPSTEEAERHPT
ncbi:hypothetical protein PF004_g13081 [Phytophthora fragariae]|uniref:ZSWIM1/3 RNaseH-like domain-containing protein n=1 Tax=Phytophthora fragariae TaxID=53985 RepID=A0A6G0NTB6_9STRA|nr:hypothetical protein PF004_g13081 [Phytophthora fragariae]